MSHPAQAAVQDRPACRDLSQLGRRAWITVVPALLLLVTGTAILWPQWRHNPDLSHGWFTPLLFLLLLHEARVRGTPRFMPCRTIVYATIVLLALVGLALLGVGSLYTAVLEPTHALVALVLTTGLCMLLAAAWLAFSLRSQRLVPVNWQAGSAILLWLLSSPLPPGTYARLTAALQLRVTEVVLGLLHLLGIAAVRTGNIIQLANTAVGVEEACSGVRSLLSCLYAGLFFSAMLLKRPGARACIIALSLPLALAMNVIRSLLLTLLANAGTDISGAWHDLTGFGILAVTAALLAWLATLLGRNEPVRAFTDTAPTCTSVPMLPWVLLTSILSAAAILLSTVLISTNVRHADRGEAAPEMTSLLPAQYPGWTTTPANDLYRFSAQLHTNHLIQRTYATDTAKGLLQVTFYVAYWASGDTPVSLVASHTPDACWPGAGWTAMPVDAPAKLSLPQRSLTEGQYRLFEREGYPQHVWYWHLFDGRSIETPNVRSPRELLKLAWKYGFRHEGPQVFVRVSSNRPWDEVAAEPLTQEIFARLARFGL